MYKLECILVGCIPSTAVAAGGGGVRDVCVPRGGVCLGGVCLGVSGFGGVCPEGDVCLEGSFLPLRGGASA